MLLHQMPIKHNYKVIFMTRPIEEVVISQSAMVNRLATKGAELDAEQLQRGLTAHCNEICNWLKRAPHMKFVEVDYPTLVRNPQAVIASVVEFLGSDRLTTPEKMAAVVDASLYRRKRDAT